MTPFILVGCRWKSLIQNLYYPREILGNEELRNIIKEEAKMLRKIWFIISAPVVVLWAVISHAGKRCSWRGKQSLESIVSVAQELSVQGDK